VDSLSDPFRRSFNRGEVTSLSLYQYEQEESDSEISYATLQIPNVVPRLYKMTVGDEVFFVPIEQIIKANLDMLFLNKKT